MDSKVTVQDTNLLIQLPPNIPNGDLPDMSAQIHDIQQELVNDPGDLQNQFQINQQVDEPELEKKEKKCKNRVHYNLCDFYNLRKVKCTLEFESPLRKKKLTRG